MFIFFRYLVFFDDGYTQYTKHEDIYVVCAQSKNIFLMLNYDIMSIFEFLSDCD